MVTNEKNEFKWKLERKNMQLQVNVEKVDKEEYKRKRVKHGLDQADNFLDTIRGQLKKVETDFREKEKWWKLDKKQKKEIRETLEAKIEDLSISLCDSKERGERENATTKRVLWLLLILHLICRKESANRQRMLISGTNTREVDMTLCSRKMHIGYPFFSMNK